MIDQNKIREVLGQAGLELKPSEADFDRPFKELGLDSLDVYNFLSEIEVAFGYPIEDSEFENIKTLNDVLKLLNNKS